MTLVLAPRRKECHCGDPIMSRKLKIPTLAWMGMEMSVAAAAKTLEIPYNHFSDWLCMESRILAETHQKRLLEHPEIGAKYNMLKQRGVI